VCSWSITLKVFANTESAFPQYLKTAETWQVIYLYFASAALLLHFRFSLNEYYFFFQNNLFTFLSHYLFDFSPWPCPLSHVPHIWISDVMSAIKAFLLSPPFLLADFICRLDLWQHRKSLRVIEFGPKWYMHGYSLPSPWQLQLIIRNVERALKWNIHRTCDLINYFLLVVKHVKPKKKNTISKWRL